MATKVRAFRSLIFLNYDSESEFAKELGWPRQRLNKITNGIMVPSLRDIDEMSPKLNVNPDQLTQIFLNQTSPNEQRISTA